MERVTLTSRWWSWLGVAGTIILGFGSSSLCILVALEVPLEATDFVALMVGSVLCITWLHTRPVPYLSSTRWRRGRLARRLERRRRRDATFLERLHRQEQSWRSGRLRAGPTWIMPSIWSRGMTRHPRD